jgi:hypothetical protein
MKYVGCASIDVFSLDETSTKSKPTAEEMEMGLAYKTKGLSHFPAPYYGLPTPRENKQRYIEDLKDSLINGSNFVFSLYIYQDIIDSVDYGDVYHFKPEYYNQTRIAHAATIVGYNDTIETQNGNGAFIVINSSGNNFMFYLDYEWFLADPALASSPYFLEEDFSSQPELAFHLSVKGARKYYGFNKTPEEKAYFVNELVDKDGKKVDYKDPVDYTFQKNVVKVHKINGQMVSNHQIVIPFGQENGVNHVISDFTELTSTSDFQSAEIIVYEPIDVEFIDENNQVIYDIEREPTLEITRSYLSVIGSDLKAKAEVKELADTTYVFSNFYSLQARNLVSDLSNEELNNGVFIKKSTSLVRRQLIIITADDFAKNTPPIITNITDTVSVYYGDLLELQFEASDSEDDEISYALTYGPDGLSLSSDGYLNYLALDAGPGEYGKVHECRIEVKDETLSSFYNLYIDVLPPSDNNYTPEFLSKIDTLYECLVGEEVAFQFSARDQDNELVESYYYSENGGEISIEYSSINLYTETIFDFEFTSDEAGVFPIIIFITDGEYQISHNLTIVASQENRSPEFSTEFASSYSTYINEQVTINFSVFDEDEDELLVEANCQDADLLSLENLGDNNYRLSFTDSLPGTYIIDLLLSDGVYEVSEEVKVVVDIPPTPPQFVSEFDTVYNIYLGDSVFFDFNVKDINQDLILVSLEDNYENEGTSDDSLYETSLTKLEDNYYNFQFIPYQVGEYSLAIVLTDGTYQTTRTIKIVAIDDTTSAWEIEEAGTNFLSVYPNPITSHVNFEINLPEFGQTRLRIINLLGQNVETIVNQKLDQGTNIITSDLSYLRPGQYLICLEQNGHLLKTFKIIKK